jgi:hypothetical protein
VEDYTINFLQGVKDNLAAILLVGFVLGSFAYFTVRSELSKLELRHFIAYIFVFGSALMLINSIVLFNLYAFGYQNDKIGFWPGALMFIGSLIAAGVASMARYCEDSPKEIAKQVGEGIKKASEEANRQTLESLRK